MIFIHIFYIVMIEQKLSSFMITVLLFNGQKYPAPSRPLSRGPAVFESRFTYFQSVFRPKIEKFPDKLWVFETTT